MHERGTIHKDVISFVIEDASAFSSGRKAFIHISKVRSGIQVPTIYVQGSININDRKKEK